MEVFKSRDVKSPVRGTEKSAGIDFFVPNNFPGTHFLTQGQDLTIESGIFAKVPKGYVLIVKNKSGIATKHGLQVGACVIDEDYQGEVIIHVRNIGLDVATIDPGQKIVQMLLVPVSLEGVEEVSSLEDLYNGEVTQRAEGKLGSTGE